MANKLPKSIESIIPNHIIEQYPNFVLFLKGYYEWMTSGNRPMDVISRHNKRMSFDESLDEYTNLLKKKYLPSFPDDIDLNKDLLIRLSRDFYRSKGSKYSYQFLFNVLYNTDVEMYIPKTDVFRLSDGKWIDDESRMLVTMDPSLTDSFVYQKIKQVRQIYKDHYEYAYASIQKVNSLSYNGYNVFELLVSSIEGTFKSGYPIETEDGVQAWLIPIPSSYNIISGGTNFSTNDILTGDLPLSYTLTYNSVTDTEVDTHISTLFSKSNVIITQNGNEINDLTYDGQIISGVSMGDVITITLPVRQGLFLVSEIDQSAITKIKIESPMISNGDTITLVSSHQGLSAEIEVYFDVVQKIDGYYASSDSQASSDKYLQDSYYYQDYSYALRSEISIGVYKDIVKKCVHPSGMMLFGIVSLYDLFSYDCELVEASITKPSIELNYLTKYSLGAPLSLMDKLKDTLNEDVFRVSAADEVQFQYWKTLGSYKLYDGKLTARNLFNDTGDDTTNQVGWMTSDTFADADYNIVFLPSTDTYTMSAFSFNKIDGTSSLSSFSFNKIDGTSSLSSFSFNKVNGCSALQVFLFSRLS